MYFNENDNPLFKRLRALISELVAADQASIHRGNSGIEVVRLSDGKEFALTGKGITRIT